MQFPSPRLVPAVLALVASLSFASLLPAEETSPAATATFSATLSPEIQVSSGLNTLTADQRKEVDRLVAREIKLAREGNVRAFAGTFISRRKPAELAKAGLATLSASQKDQLNTLVADAIANRPPDATSMVYYSPKREGDEPIAVAMKRKLIVHGGMSFTAGWGSNGSNFQSASAYSTFTDPQSKTSVTVAVSSTRGKGYFGYPGYYGYGLGGYGYGYGNEFGLGLEYPLYDTSFDSNFSARRGLGPTLYDSPRL